MNIYACTVILIIFSQKNWPRLFIPSYPSYRVASRQHSVARLWHHGNILWLACDQRAGGSVEGRNSAAFEMVYVNVRFNEISVAHVVPMSMVR